MSGKDLLQQITDYYNMDVEDTIPDMDKVEYCSNLDGEKCGYKIKGQKNLVTSKDQIIQNE